MQAKWEKMFGVKKEKVVEEVKVKKPRKKAVAKKKVEGDVMPELQGEKKPRARKAATPKKTADPASTVTKRTTAKKPKIADEK